MALLDGTGFDERLLLRGSPKTPGPVTPRRILEALGGPRSTRRAERKAAGLELARRLADPANPLVSRVLVNRVWHHLFGRGIVASTDNFGVLGSAPSHPELLDHLADHFVHDGWSIKRLLRMIMTSSTYQMASRGDMASATVDPQNLLLSRTNFPPLGRGADSRHAAHARRRRRSIDVRPIGRSVYLPAYVEGMGRPKTGPLDGAGRRTVYTKVRRNFLPAMQLAFDMPAPFSSMGRRSESNVPAAGVDSAQRSAGDSTSRTLGKRVLASPDQPAGPAYSQMYLEAFAREPLPDELHAGLAFLERDGELHGLPSRGLGRRSRRFGPISRTCSSIPRNSSTSIEISAECRRLLGWASPTNDRAKTFELYPRFSLVGRCPPYLLTIQRLKSPCIARMFACHKRAARC